MVLIMPFIPDTTNLKSLPPPKVQFTYSPATSRMALVRRRKKHIPNTHWPEPGLLVQSDYTYHNYALYSSQGGYVLERQDSMEVYDYCISVLE